MGRSESSTNRSSAATATPSDDLLQVARLELDGYHRRAEVACAGVEDWRSRLRATIYVLYRYLAEGEALRHRLLVDLRAAEGAALLVGAEVETLSGLIDEGRAEPSAPPTLTRTTAESLAGAIFWQLSLAAGRSDSPPPEAELVGGLMFAAVLPYLGRAAAAEELRIAPPPR